MLECLGSLLDVEEAELADGQDELGGALAVLQLFEEIVLSEILQKDVVVLVRSLLGGFLDYGDYALSEGGGTLSMDYRVGILERQKSFINFII